MWHAQLRVTIFRFCGKFPNITELHALTQTTHSYVYLLAYVAVSDKIECYSIVNFKAMPYH